MTDRETAATCLRCLDLVKSNLSDEAATPARFQLGACSLLDALCEMLQAPAGS